MNHKILTSSLLLVPIVVSAAGQPGTQNRPSEKTVSAEEKKEKSLESERILNLNRFLVIVCNELLKDSIDFKVGY